MFHSGYRDNRPQWLKDSHTWSVEQRPIMTSITISDDRLAQVIDLAIEHDIHLKYGSRTNPNSKKGVSFLLGTFLHAVLRGYLVETGGYKSTHQVEVEPDKAKPSHSVPSSLTEEQINEIQLLYSQGWKQSEIANKFSISRSYVSIIVNRENNVFQKVPSFVTEQDSNSSPTA